MVYNRIQLFALNVPDRISLPFELYALEVPQHWKELFNRLQQHKLGRSPVLPPIKCLNQYLQLLVEDLLFPNRFAFSPKSNSKWIYAKSDSVDTEYIASIVRAWARISFEDLDTNFLTNRDIQTINAMSGKDLKFNKIALSEEVWKIQNGGLVIDPLYYSLIPYLFSSAIASAPLTLVNPAFTEDSIKFDFRESISANSSSSEVISWAPECIVRGKEKKTTHYYSYHATFKLDYHPGGVPYLNCDYGVRRWVNWELGYLPTGVTVYFNPTGSLRFAPAVLKYLGKKRGVDFEGNLPRLIKELNNNMAKFTREDVISSPYKNHDNRLEWAAVYNTRMSRSHHVNPGIFPPDIASFHQSCLERVACQSFGSDFTVMQTYVRYETKSFKKSLSQHNKVKEFIELEAIEPYPTAPFEIPVDLRLLVLIQDAATQLVVEKLGIKYGLKNIQAIGIGKLGGELAGISSDLERKQRILEFQESLELKAALLGSSPDTKTLVLLEILPKSHFWKNPNQDPKPCFRPALAMLGCIAKCFEPQEELEPPSPKGESSEVEFERRVEKTFLRGLAMTGAYLPTTFEAEQFPPNPTCVGVYAIPCYSETKRQYFPVAVRIDRDRVMAKGYGCSQWMNIYDFQIEMGRGSIFKPIESKQVKSEIQRWIFNSLFTETKQPTIYCFDTQNLRDKGLLFLQKKYWRKDNLAFSADKDCLEFIALSKYPHVRVASILTPDSLEVPIYRACDESGDLEGHTQGVFYPSDLNPDCGYYYLSNQKPSNRSGTILKKSTIFSMETKGGKSIKPQPSAQGYNPRGIFLNLTLQAGDRASDWASFVQCHRLYGLIHHLDATTYPAELHLAEGLRDYLPIQAIA